MTTTIDMDTGAIVGRPGPDEARNATRAQAAVSLATAAVIGSAEDYQFAAEELRAGKAMRKAMDEERRSFTDPMNAIVDKFNAKFMPHIKLFDKAEEVWKSKMSAWQIIEQNRLAAEQRERQRLADEERRRLEAEAKALREKQEAEERAAAKAEQDRQAAARAEQARIEAEADAARGKKAKAEAEERARIAREEETARQQRAAQEQEEARRRAEEAAMALEQTAAVVTAAPAAPVFKPTGISTPKRLDYAVTDKAAFMRFVLDHRPDLIGLWDVDPTKMRALVKLQGTATDMPGLKVIETVGVSVR